MSNTRTAGKYGRLPAKFPGALRDLTYYVAGSLPAAPAEVAVPNFPNWGILGNQDYGDCGVAGLQHGLEAAATDTGESEKWASEKQVVDYYMKYTGGQDSGVVLSDFLAYARKNGFLGHKVNAYAPVAVHDVPTLQFAINAYDFCYTGITVTQAMEDAFGKGQPWTTTTAKGEVLGGHCVPAIGYDETGLTVVTWGEPQVITWSAWHRISSEAWAIVSGEVASKGADGHGINLAALQADLSQLDK